MKFSTFKLFKVVTSIFIAMITSNFGADYKFMPQTDMLNSSATFVIF